MNSFMKRRLVRTVLGCDGVESIRGPKRHFVAFPGSISLSLAEVASEPYHQTAASKSNVEMMCNAVL